ncbi:DBP [Betabaculovirus altermyunipunctae]|uniref:DBP n=1 Tax=Betabaculovirus altermyunipunctae TaxID=3051996 RepID=A0A1S5YDZ3_9BBAC|nr:DBP [Betabaculovirus altermyunipunctae]AQQ80349.1 DBP [Betabaculovirus altermyunipunctae]
MSLVPVTKTANQLVVDEGSDVIYDIQNQVITRMNCNVPVLRTNNMIMLKKQTSFLRNCLPLEKLENAIEIEDNGTLKSDKINLQMRKGPICSYYNVGLRVEGGIINFYTVDRCNVRLCKSEHGDFLTFEGDNYPLYINTYQSVMASTLKKQFLMISKTKLYSIGTKDEAAKRQSMLQKFYVARGADNEELLTSGELKEDQVVTISPMTMDEFETLFPLEKTKKTTEPVEFVVGAIIKGVNKGLSRDDVLKIDGSSDTNSSVYTLNIIPEIFVYFQKHVVSV